MSDAGQWHEMARHLVRGHGADPDGLAGWAPTLEQLRFGHADTHVALASQNTQPPDGHSHTWPVDAGWPGPRKSSYRPFPPSPDAREDHFGWPLPYQDGLPHTYTFPDSEADLADWAAGRFTHPGAQAAVPAQPDWIRDAAVRASAAALARTSFPGPALTCPATPSASAGTVRARHGVPHPARGRRR